MDTANLDFIGEHKYLSPPTFKKGGCVPGICGEEAACVPGKNLTHKCVCPSDLSPPTPDLHCPFRRTVPVSGKPFKISVGNSVTEKSKGEDIAVIVIMLAVILIMFLLGMWVKRRYFFWIRDEQVRMAPIKRQMVKNPEYVGSPMPMTVLSKDSLQFHHEIGEGCFGKVFKGELFKDDGTSEIVAIKVLKETANHEVEEDFMREVAIMNNFRHENILIFIGIACKESTRRPWMVFEFMPFGDLAELLRKNGGIDKNLPEGMQPWSKSLMLWVGVQIANGMKYLSNIRFVHNDLACRNILVARNYIAKIADFGMSRDVYISDYYRLNRSKPLPLRWMSPESLVYRKFTLESDVWAFGVVLWEIYNLGKQPYFGHGNGTAMNLIMHGQLLTPPSNCPPYIRQLMADCWQKNPKARPNFKVILSTLYKHYKLIQAKYPKHCQEFPQPEDYVEDISEEPPPNFPGTYKEEFGVYIPDETIYAELDVKEPEYEIAEQTVQEENYAIQTAEGENYFFQTFQKGKFPKQTFKRENYPKQTVKRERSPIQTVQEENYSIQTFQRGKFPKQTVRRESSPIHTFEGENYSLETFQRAKPPEQTIQAMQTIQSMLALQMGQVQLPIPEEEFIQEDQITVAVQTSPIMERKKVEEKQKPLKHQVPRAMVNAAKQVKFEVINEVKNEIKGKIKNKTKDDILEEIKEDIKDLIHANDRRRPLPRPPFHPVPPSSRSDQDLLDADNYLSPRVVQVHVYLEPLPE